MTDLWFWWILFFVDLLIPFSMILFGRMMWKHPAKEPGQKCYGYYTAMSQKNQETWEFAQRACGCFWWKAGWTLLIVSVAAQLPFRGRGIGEIGTAGLILCGIQCACLIGTMFYVEAALRRSFYPDGSRREGGTT